jgi:hypothetical protein
MLSISSVCLVVGLLERPIQQPGVLAALSLLVLNALLIVPIGGLFAFHIVLVSKGQTTNEHVTGKYKGMKFFSRGCCANFLHLFFGSFTPQYKRVIIKKSTKKIDKKVKKKNKNSGYESDKKDEIEIQVLNANGDKNNEPTSIQDNELLELVQKSKRKNKEHDGSTDSITSSMYNKSSKTNNNTNHNTSMNQRMNQNNTSFDSSRIAQTPQ